MAIRKSDKKPPRVPADPWPTAFEVDQGWRRFWRKRGQPPPLSTTIDDFRSTKNKKGK